MAVLAIDTALDHCAIGLISGQQSWRCQVGMRTGQMEAIAELTAGLLTQAHLAPADVQRVVTTTGPGSFVGLRVGLAFAKGFASARDIPLVGLSTLDALLGQLAAKAAEVSGQAGLGPQTQGPAIALIAAAGGFFARMGASRSAPEPTEAQPPDLAPFWASPADLLARLPPLTQCHFVGPGAAAFLQAMCPEQANDLMPAPDLLTLDPVHLARMGQDLDPATHPARALYLRAPYGLLSDPASQ